MRIIAGEWRGRRLPIAHHPGLRPSTDRVRETLFNWLQCHIAGARCLDLFAGAGGLGFEAASRGASEVVMLEQAPNISAHLQQQVSMLGTGRVQVINQDALQWLQSRHSPHAFDILFIDPPFQSPLIHQVIDILNNSALIAPETMIYIETAAETELVLPKHWQPHRSGKAGQVAYGLWRVALAQ